MDKQLLHRILSVQSSSYQTEKMRSFVRIFADSIGAVWEERDGNIYVTKGYAEVYPCVVAHTDTVHNIVPDSEFMVLRDKGVYFGWNPVKSRFQGVGGDDKVGVYIALAALEHFPACKAVFFRDEEIGCLGSSLAEFTFFDDCAFVLECDRKGNGDFVDDIYGTQMFGAEFKLAVDPILMRYGYRRTGGGITDVGQLKEDGLPIVAANMSCGYFNPHTANEYIVIKDVQRCQRLVFAIIEQLGDRQWFHCAPQPSWKASYTSVQKRTTVTTNDSVRFYWDVRTKQYLNVVTHEPVTFPQSTLAPLKPRTVRTYEDWDRSRQAEWDALYTTETQTPSTALEAVRRERGRTEPTGEYDFSQEDADAAALDAALRRYSQPSTRSDEAYPLLAPNCPICGHSGHVEFDEHANLWACYNCEGYIQPDDDINPDGWGEEVPQDVRDYVRLRA